MLKYIPKWQYRDHILDLVREISNPSAEDPYFPVVRYAIMVVPTLISKA